MNPDIVLHEEDPDGGLLFNPNTNQFRVLNHTGLFIWKLCDSNHGLKEIIAGIRETTMAHLKSSWLIRSRSKWMKW